jgi:hypothetical protein
MQAAAAVPRARDHPPKAFARRRRREEGDDRLQEVRLIVLHRPEIRPAASDHPSAEVALAELGIAGDDQAVQSDRLQQGGGQTQLVLAAGAPFCPSTWPLRCA